MISYTDGGSRNNPGQAAIGIVLKDKDNSIIEQIGLYIGIKTNNEAEYTALINALKHIHKNYPTEKEVSCFLDSELVVKQLQGLYKVKDEKLKQLHREVLDLTKNFSAVNFTHVLRAKNKEADLIVNRVLDEQEKASS